MPDSMSNSNHIAAGGLFGLFLAQILCLLSQPVGSLWYMVQQAKQPLRPDNILLLAPQSLGCFVETVLLLFALADILMSAILRVPVEARQDFNSRLYQGVAAFLLLQQHGARWRPPCSGVSTETAEGQTGPRDLHGDVESGTLRELQTVSRLLIENSFQASPISEFMPRSDIIIDKLFAVKGWRGDATVVRLGVAVGVLKRLVHHGTSAPYIARDVAFAQQEGRNRRRCAPAYNQSTKNNGRGSDLRARLRVRGTPHALWTTRGSCDHAAHNRVRQLSGRQCSARG